MLDTVKQHISIMGWPRDVRHCQTTHQYNGGPEMLDTVKQHISMLGWYTDVSHCQTSHQYNQFNSKTLIIPQGAILLWSWQAHKKYIKLNGVVQRC